MEFQTKEYSYKHKVSWGILGTLGFGFLLYVSISKFDGTLYSWLATGSIAAFWLMAFFSLLMSFAKPRQIILSENGLTMPSSPTKWDIISIPYTDIREIQIKSIMNLLLIVTISHLIGKVVIPQNMLDSKAAMDEFLRELLARVGEDTKVNSSYRGYIPTYHGHTD